MHFKLKSIISVLLSATILFSCSDDNNPPNGLYGEGVFIVNEGQFGQANGSLSFYNRATGTVTANIFRAEPLNFAGAVFQSLYFADEKAYMVMNAGNKIEIADALNFKLIKTISGTKIINPRYVVKNNGKLYVSVWGNFDENFALVNSYVLEIDEATGSILREFDTDEGTEELLIVGDKLLAANNNFGGSNTVSVINLTTGVVSNKILAAGPTSFAVDANGAIWVLCSGTGELTSARLIRLNKTTFEVERSITISQTTGNDLGISPDKTELFYLSEGKVFRMNINATSEPTNYFIFEENLTIAYSLGVDPVTGAIWIGDAINYTSNGKAFKYNASGVFEKEISTGISPTQFIFK
jgi:DNA-binding beta-propeller fold protein YncE